MSADELAGRRQGTAASTVASSSNSADDDRRLAAADRRQAASYLSAAYRDDTTGALNRRPGREQMQVLLERARRDASDLTFVFVDVDGLKRVNDSHGHYRGDSLLAAVGTALRSSLRSYDLVVRYGGDEFVCALPGGSAEVAQQIIARVGLTLDDLVPGATVSAGYAELRPADALDEVIRRADSDLYRRRGMGHSSVDRRLSAVGALPEGVHGPSVACGACGGRIDLAEFVLELTHLMTRTADCQECGATTLIQLGQASTARSGPSDCTS
jgi:diguanylate cyclase (GGDEF)-like protein